MAQPWSQAHTLGEAVETEYEAALEEFRKALRDRRSREELLALEIRQVEQHWFRQRGGMYRITTTVHGRRRQDDIVRFGRYTISGAYVSWAEH